MNKRKSLNRIFHPWWDWECYKSGFYSTEPPNGETKETCLKKYAEFLSDLKLFDKNISALFSTWKNSCEHFLSNESINRVAWIGQASMCIYSAVPSCYRGGYRELTTQQQRAADNLAESRLNKWILGHENNAHI